MLARTLHTVRYLKPVQIYGRLWRGRARTVSLDRVPGWRPAEGAWTFSISRADPQTGPNRFRFLNDEREVETWNDAGTPKLWLYNLHYFEHCSAERMERWVAGNPPAAGNGWEPYPLSLRIVHWIRWRLEGQTFPPRVPASLALQAECLSRSVEHHLQANHLFVNAKALVFAGTVFHGRRPAEWLRDGLAILRAQLAEQVLPDGGHIERSPMYHALILEDLLDLINLSAAYPGAIPGRDRSAWQEAAGRMLSWLAAMCHPDGRISFFNDAAFGIAPEPEPIRAYAERLGVVPVPGALAESGYIRLSNARAVVLFDAAPIGPDYQPGHAHADTLSFELSVDGRRVLVNAGTSTYEANALRAFQRSTAAHNTASVDQTDSSEVWSAFRVARRARVRDRRTDGNTWAEASHTGYERLASPVIHRRRLELAEDELRVIDSFDGVGMHEIRVHFHSHPLAAPAIELDAKLGHEDVATHWYPEFNRQTPNQTVTGTWRGRCPVSFTTVIRY